MDTKEISEKISIKSMLDITNHDWKSILNKECQVYTTDSGYLAKRFDQINYEFCSKESAKEILVDNLYALLKFKYFPKRNDDIDSRIDNIVKSFCSNLKTSLIKVSFDKSADCEIVSMLPDGCVAFRNGVFDFKTNDWLFKYEKISLQNLRNTIYLYPHKYIILWYMDYDFSTLDIDIKNTELTDFIEIIKELNKTQRSYCFELLYNIAHDEMHQFSRSKFEHLCEILGYTMLQSFSQFFVFLIGSGSNGKNSLFDGCFTNKLKPAPAANDIDSIETDRFITGSLLNKSHNIFLETSPKVYTVSTKLKALTGSMYQTIEEKGVNKFSGIINCKYIFAGNDQDNIKFSDTTIGFRRRLNLYEVSYQWDENKRFLTKGDYYDTTFSQSLAELKDDIINTTIYAYFAMYGLKSATNNFTKDFRFTHNDWTLQYADIDEDFKLRFSELKLETIIDVLQQNKNDYAFTRYAFYTDSRQLLIQTLPVNEQQEMYDYLLQPDNMTSYFANNDIYVSMKLLQMASNYLKSAKSFTADLKKAYPNADIINLYSNKAYLKCNFINGKLTVVMI